jgi:two-component system response regulator YesN
LEGYDLLYKVLLVDDDKSTLYGLRQFKEWEFCGFIIKDEARDGLGALKKLSEKNFDLIITDIRMPGMDGLRFLNKIKESKLDVCLMIMSTYNEFEYAQQGIRLGVFDYIMKPVDDNILSNALSRVKCHLDEKYHMSQRQKTEEMLIKDNLSFFYPASQERKIIELIMLGQHAVIEEAANVCFELYNLTNYDKAKTVILLEKMLLKMKDAINMDFPWLATIENLNIEWALDDEKPIRGIKAEFLGYIKNMLKIITKYDLCCSDGVVGKTCQYVLAHVEEDITIDSIAAEIHISGGYLGKLFKQKTGVSIPEYVTKIKMEQAKYLLSTGEYKNYEVSEKLGYCTPNYFCRLFKEYTGVTPMEFRKGGF